MVDLALNKYVSEPGHRKLIKESIAHLKDDEKKRVVYQVVWALMQHKGEVTTDVVKETIEEFVSGDIFATRYFAEERKKAEMKYDISINRYADVEEGYSKCPRCGNNRLRKVQHQRRSADEGMTTEYTCIKCNYKWTS